jgi:general secretion pathway protein K
MENQRLQLQTKWIQRGALDWAILVLQGSNLPFTSLDQPWATPLAETRLDQYIERERVEGERYDATLSGNITDACALYNLRNLADGKTPDEGHIVAFGQLLANVGMDKSLARRVAQYVAAGETAVVTPPPTPGDGSTPPKTTQTQSPVQGTPMRFLQVDDLLSVPGFTPEMVERLRPFVIVLPDKTPVNVNTAAPEVLAAMLNGMSVSEANALVVRRKQAPWISIAMFDAQLSGKAAVAPDSLATRSDWYLINSRIRLDRAALDAESLIQRQPLVASGGGTRVVWIRQY